MPLLPPHSSPNAYAWVTLALQLLALKRGAELAVYARCLEGATSMAEMDRWLDMLHDATWGKSAFGSQARCTLPETAETVRRRVREVMSTAGVLPQIQTSIARVHDLRGSTFPTKEVRVYHVDLYDAVTMALADTALNNAATLVFPGTATADQSHPACSTLDAWRYRHIAQKFRPAAQQLHQAGRISSPTPLVIGVELAADATGVNSIEPMYMRLVNGPLAAINDRRATHLFALVDYPDVPPGLSSADETIFRIRCAQAALDAAVIRGLQVRVHKEAVTFCTTCRAKCTLASHARCRLAGTALGEPPFTGALTRKVSRACSSCTFHASLPTSERSIATLGSSQTRARCASALETISAPRHPLTRIPRTHVAARIKRGRPLGPS